MSRLSASPPASPLVSPLPGESSRAHAAFVVYVGLGPGRTLDATARALADAGRPLSRRQVGTLSARFNWVERARAHDADEAARVLEARGEATVSDEVEGYRVRQLRLAVELHAAVAGLLRLANARLASLDAADLRPQDVARFAEAAAKLAAVASSAESQCIGLNELLGLLREQEDAGPGSPFRPAPGEA